jgi:hypothetical protein
MFIQVGLYRSIGYRILVLVHYVQSVPGGKVNILGGHSIDHSKQKYVYVYMYPIPNGFRDSCFTVQTSNTPWQVTKCIDVDDGIFENVLY